MNMCFRIARPEDAAGILAIYSPYCESSHVSFEVVAPSEAHMRQRIERITKDYPWIVVEIDGDVTGYAYASQFRERAAYRWAVEVAVYVAPGHRQRGLGRLLYECLFKLLRDQGYFKAYASIALPNEPSARLHETVGFRHVAIFPKIGYKLGRWIDLGWWEFDLQPEIAEPPEPRSISVIRDDEAVAEALRDACERYRGGAYNRS